MFFFFFLRLEGRTLQIRFDWNRYVQLLKLLHRKIAFREYRRNILQGETSSIVRRLTFIVLTVLSAVSNKERLMACNENS
jgi:hypothetical protein